MTGPWAIIGALIVVVLVATLVAMAVGDRRDIRRRDADRPVPRAEIRRIEAERATQPGRES